MIEPVPEFPHKGIQKEIDSGHCRDEIRCVQDYVSAFVKGRDEALTYLANRVGKDLDGWSASRIADLHHQQFSFLYKDAGAFRGPGVLANFGDRIAADPDIVRPELDLLEGQCLGLIRNFHKEAGMDDIPAKLKMLAFFHGRLVFIHPFRDGNGRTARLATAWIERTLFPDHKFRQVTKETYMRGMRCLPKDLGPLMNWLAAHLGLEIDPFLEVLPPYPVQVTLWR